MTKKTTKNRAPQDPLLKEMVRIRNLLTLDLLVRGVRSDDVDRAVRLGASHIRGTFPMRDIRRRMQNAED